MRDVQFSPLVHEKLGQLRERLLLEYSVEKTESILNGILDDADNLSLFPQSGVDISGRYELDTDYWYLFTHHHYLVYRAVPDQVVIVQMFHEREDFMMKLFGISGRSQESIDYWGE